MKKITVVIPNFNGMQYVERCLDSLERQTFSDFDVIFVDNGSVDGSRELTEEKYPWVKVIALAENTGFCKAVNLGIEATQTPYVVLLNNDTEAEPDFLKELYLGIERKKNAFSGAARMLQFHDRGKMDDAGNYYNCLGWAFALGKGKPEENYLKERKIFASCGGAAIYRTELVKKLGGFDEEHFAYLEDIDLGYRAQIAGYKNWYLPKAGVYHVGSGTSGSRYNQFKIRYSSRNNIYMLYKNMPLLQILLNLPFLILVLTLVGFGLVMLASASSAVALYRRGDAWAYLRPQLLYAALGLCGMWLASRVDYHIFHKLAWPLLGLSLILLAAVLFMPEYNGCKRWLVIPGFGTLQPSEIAKFAVVLVFSHIIALNHDRMKDFSVGVLPFALVLGVVAALMLLEPHLSGTVLILGIGAVLMFVGGTGLRWFLLAGAGGVGAIGAAVAVMPDLVPYAADRLRSWLDPFADPLGDGHQTIQSLYAIGSGGATGLGLGESRQKHLFVPEPQNDFIFSIVCEELGFVGACAVVGLFVLLLCRGITIAAHAPDRFGALLVVGFVVQVALQAVLNVAVVTNTIPNTGISLPFFSSGGTSLMMLLGEMGVVLGVSRGEA